MYAIQVVFNAGTEQAYTMLHDGRWYTSYNAYLAAIKYGMKHFEIVRVQG